MPNDNSAGNISGFKLVPGIDTEQEVLEIRQRARKAWGEGRLLVEASGNGTEFKKEIIATPGEIIAECNRFLRLINPQKYGYIVRQSTMYRFG